MADRGIAPGGAAGDGGAPENADARVEAELSRDPDRANTKVARASHASVLMVRRVRERLRAYPTKPS